MSSDTIEKVLVDAIEGTAELTLTHGHDAASRRLGFAGGRYRFRLPDPGRPDTAVDPEILETDPDTRYGLEILRRDNLDREPALRRVAAHTLTAYLRRGELTVQPAADLGAPAPDILLHRGALRALRRGRTIRVCFLEPPWPDYAAQAQEALEIAMTSGVIAGGSVDLEALRWDYTGDGSMEAKLMLHLGPPDVLERPANVVTTLKDTLELPEDAAAARQTLAHNASALARLVGKSIERHLG